MEYELYTTPDDELVHWGIKGMRWGVRRYQRKDGSLTRAGLRRQQKQREAALEKARQVKAEKKAHEENRARVLQSGSAREVLAYKGELTSQEMQTAISRIRWEQDMQSLASKDVVVGKSKTDKILSKLDTVTGQATTLIKGWNTVANIINAFNDSGTMMPKIDTNIASDNRDKRKQEQAAKSKTGKKTSVNKTAKDIENMTDDELADYIKRANSERVAKNYAVREDDD